VAHVEQFLERKAGVTKGKVVLATVYGDVHDIGKNLVKTILANNGYTVFDLGKQVPANVIIDKAIEEHADAIGLSALLVSTSKQMPLIVQELHRRGLDIPVLIGGAAINRKFGRRISFVDPEQHTAYAPGVFYCKDAFEGLESMDQLQDPNKRAAFVARIQSEARRDASPREAPAAPAILVKSQVTEHPASIPTPAYLGCARDRSTCRWSWCSTVSTRTSCSGCRGGAKNAHGNEWQTLKAEFEAPPGGHAPACLAGAVVQRRGRSMGIGRLNRRANHCWSLIRPR